MSRHRLIKNLDIEDELDTYDGGYEDDDDYDVDEQNNGEAGLSPEDELQLDIAAIEVREVLGPDAPVTENQIKEALWYYYYDVDKQICTSTRATFAKSETPEAAGGAGSEENSKQRLAQDLIPQLHISFDFSTYIADAAPIYCFCQYSQEFLVTSKFIQESVPARSWIQPGFSTSDFFKDTPFLKVPPDRLANIIVQSLHPKGGLLGGSPSQAGGSMSKLAALAAARKKENSNGLNSSAEKKTSHLAALRKLGTHKQLEKDKACASLAPREVQSHSHRYLRQMNQPRRDDKNGLFTTESSDKNKPFSERVSAVQEPSIEDYRSSPSLFAQTLLGTSLEESSQKQRHDFIDANLTIPFALEKLALGYSVVDSEYGSSSKLQKHSEYSSMSQGRPADLFTFTVPSPDDIVLKAQNSKGGTKSKSQKPIRQAAAPTEPTVQPKNIDVVSEFKKLSMKKSTSFVVIGHVDAGKSTLMGRLLYDLGAIDERTIFRYKKEASAIGKSSFAFAWVFDQASEERTRGVTIDISMNKFETQNTSFTILDAPGHRDFVPNMIAGASQADFAVLVVDASTGSFESGLKGQTREHALLVRSMGVQRLIVAVNKMDTVNWSQDRFVEIEQQLTGFLTSTGFQSKNLAFVPCSGLTGDNIARALDPKLAPWYTSKPHHSLIDELEASEPSVRALDKPLRLTIADVFKSTVPTYPISISGRVECGTIKVGERVLVQPSGEFANIKAVEVNGEIRDWGVAGQNLILHLANIDPIHLKPGDVVCAPSAPVPLVKEFSIKLLAFEHLTPMSVDVHRGRLFTAGRIAKLSAILNKVDGKVVKKRPRLVRPGEVARVQVELYETVPLEAPTRVILRAGGETVAAGLVE